MIRKVDWSELEPYENNIPHSFEVLCYQIATSLFEEIGPFTPIDDSGGGDGVEFYLTLENGDEWGWQAKFYYPEKRLNKSNRKQSIINSLKRACEIHPRLKKWFLCTPTDFTKKEHDWFKDTLCQSIPKNMDVKLVHWGDSKFNAWLSEPRFSGKRNYFFDELELDFEWFKTQFEKEKAAIDKKFDSNLHTETNVDAEIHALLGDEKFVEQITKSIEKLEEELADLKDAVDNLNNPVQKDIEWDVTKKEKVADAAKSLQNVLIKTINQFKQAEELLKKKMLFEAQAINWEFVIKRLEDALKTYRTVIDESDLSKITYTGESAYKERILDDTKWLVHRPDSIIANLLDDFLYYDRCILINESNLNILGGAGIGKTHIACNICENRLENGLPALFVRGSQFTTDQPIRRQLQGLLDIPPSRSWNEFLQALSAAAEVYQTRIPLIIDGLNESTHNGAFSRVWKSGLRGFIQEIAQTKNVVLITTCRTSYKDEIWEDEYPPNSVYAYGFDTDEVKEEAIEKYFNTYKIKADLTSAPLRQFEHPLHLKIFCEVKNSERKSEQQVYLGEETLFEVFEEYLEQRNEVVCEHFGLHEATRIVESALNKMAAYLWERRSRHIPLEELVHMVDDQSLDKLIWSSSKTRAIENEGLLLIYRDWVEGTEVVGFTHDLFGGYLIARYLVQQAANHGQGYLHRTVSNLFGKHNSSSLPSDIRKCLATPFLTKIRRFWYNLWGQRTEHPLCDDIGRCLAALLLSKDQFLHEFSDSEKAFNLLIRALFEISPKYINENCTDLIACLFEFPQCRKPLLELTETTVGHPDHPFYSPFWSKQLTALSMLERDLSWSEHVRFHRENIEKRLMRFEQTCRNTQNLSEVSVQRLHLLAEYIMWILTSTVRPLRDKATRALYWYGRRFPQEFFDLVMKSFKINDPYVPERMLAATYGIAMARQNDFEDTSFVTEILPEYAKQLYESMFKPDAPHATTHILARDYARRTIDLALIHHPDLLTEDEQERITPPFADGGIRKWGECEDGDAGPYQSGAAPVQMDFGNYTLGCLVKDRGNYNFEHPEYKRVRANIFWRIYNLGFLLDSFGEIDGRLGAENYRKYGRSANGGKTDRYGKKYSWIAFYELTGFRQDNGLLPDYYENDRISGADIDPSFPTEERKHNLITEDFLGDREIPVEEWIAKTNPPDLTPYLKVNNLCKQQGDWVLLQGSLSQEDKKDSRDMFASLQGLIVKPEETEKIIETFMNQESMDRSNMPFCPEDYYTYAGEVPWCDTYPENSCEEIQIEIGKASVPERRVKFLRDGKPIPWEETHKFWDSITNLIEKEDTETLKERLREQNLDITIETVEIEKPEHQTFEVLVPVRENNWEDHRSAMNANRSVAIPSRQISETFGLCGQPQSFDLFEKDGRRASISFRYGEKFGERQYFTYLRQDLLERYLAEIDAELIWVIWGERRQVSQNPGAPYKYFHEVKAYRDIRKASGGS